MTDQTTLHASRWFPPDVTRKLPPLSPPFQTVDDAARYAHELIGDRRNATYTGCILIKDNGHYFSTHPVTSETGRFEPWSVLSTDSLGQLKHPDGYTCCAFYYSGDAHYSEVEHGYGGSPEEVATRISFFISPDLYVMLGISRFASIHYLSGLNGSLIKYQSSGSEPEKRLIKKLVSAAETLTEPFTSVVDAVRELAASGTLSVIQATEVWHSKIGVLDSTFSVYRATGIVDIDPVILQRPAFGPLLSSEEAALDDMISRIRQTPESNYGFILRHAERQQYMVTEPVTGAMDFLVRGALGTDGDTDRLLSAGYEIMAVYGCEGEYHDPQQVPAVQTSLFKNFIHPRTFETGIGVALRLGSGTAHRSLPLYIATRDGALLRYVSVLSADEQKLFAKLPPAEGGDMELARNLLADVEPTLSYIQSVANAGELSIVRTSDQWSPMGRVESHWHPYQHVVPLSLSPSFLDADQAARYAHEHIAQRVDAVYGGLVYQGLDGRFFSTLPVPVLTEIFDPEALFTSGRTSRVPLRSRLVGIYQSHRVRPLQLWRSEVSEQLNRTMIAPHLLFEALKERLGVSVHYFSAHDGTLLKYTTNQSPVERLLNTQLSPPAKHPQRVKSNAIETGLRANALTPEAYIHEVASAGKLDVLVPSTLWGPRGQVTGTWRPQPPTEARGPNAGLIYSQIFSSEEDAMRYAHHNMGERKTRQSGCVLQSMKGDEFVVVEPVNGKRYTRFGDFLLSHETPLGSFAPGFYPCALYLAAPKIPVRHTRDQVYGNFFSPQDLGAMILKLHGSTTRVSPVPAFPPLYLSTRDGALLRYRTSDVSQDLEDQLFRDAGQALQSSLEAGRISALGYVRRVAYVGQLEVLVISAQWSLPGLVNKDWTPGATIDVAPPAEHTGGEVDPRPPRDEF